MKKIILVCLGVVMTLCQVARADPTAVIDINGKYTGINDLDVNGSLYNVSFMDGTEASVYGGIFTFTNSTDAAMAATAIYSALPSFFPALDADPGLMFGCEADAFACQIMTAYDFDEFGDTAVVSMRNGRESQLIQNGNESFSFASSGDTTNFYLSNGAAYVWAKWSPSAVIPAVPEPQTYAMLLAGLGFIGFVTYRKKSFYA